MTPKDAIVLAQEKNAEVVDLKFMDFIGTWQHFSIPLSEYEEEIFEDGLGFDGSSIRGCSRLTPRTCSSSQMRPPPSSIRSVHPNPVPDLQYCRSDHQRGLFARPAQYRPAKPRRISNRAAWAT